MMLGNDEIHSEPGRELASRLQDLLRDKRHGYVRNYAELDSRISRQGEEAKEEEQVKRSARRGVSSTAASLNHQP